MIDGLLDGEPLVRAELQQALEKIDGVVGGVRESLFPLDCLSPSLTSLLQIALNKDKCFFAVDEAKLLVRRHEEAQCQSHFVGVVLAWEEDRPLHKLGKDAADRPHVQALRVRLLEE